MQPPGMTENDERGTVRTRRASRWSRVRPGRSLLMFPAVVAAGWVVLVGVLASASQLVGPEEDRGTWGGVIGAVIGNFVIAFVLALVVSAMVRLAGVSETGATPRPVDRRPPTPPGGSQPATAPHPPDGQMMRRVAIGGVLGGLPGLLIALVPLLLHGFGFISSDQSQIGFVGVPLLIIGTIVGTLTAASDSRCRGAALLGVGAGFVVGVLVNAGLGAARAGTGAIFLFLVPLGMIVGALLGTYLCARHTGVAVPDAGRPRNDHSPPAQAQS